MLRNKAMLTGLGIGMIIAAVALQLIYESEKAIAFEPEETGARQLKEEAEKLGLQLVDRDEQLFTTDEVEAKVQAALAERDSQDNNNGKIETANHDQIYAFTVGSGTNVSTIAYMLVEMGMIDDWRAFVDEVKERDLSQKVQAKYYIFHGKPDLNTLISALTSPEQ